MSWLGGAVILGGVGASLFRMIVQLERFPALPPMLFLFGAATMYVLVLVLYGNYWALVTRDMQKACLVGPFLRVYLVSQLGKYVPGKMAALALRLRLLHPAMEAGPAVLLAASAYELGMTLSTGVVCSGIALAATGIRLKWISPWCAIVVGGMLLACGSPPLLRLARRLSSRLTKHPGLFPIVTWRSFFAGIATGFFSTLLVAGTVSLLAPTESGKVWIRNGAAAVLSNFAGIACPVAPAGIGVREWGFVQMLEGSVPTDNALCIALLWRAIQLVVDVILATTCWLLERLDCDDHASAIRTKPSGTSRQNATD